VNQVIVLQLLPGLLANVIADVPEIPIPRFDEGPGKKLDKENPEECVLMVVNRQKRLASAFREYMTKGQTCHTSNSNRRTFYNQVIKLANEVNFRSFPAFVRITVLSSLCKVTDELATTMNLTMAGTF
jgi:hypothetical protein